MADSLAPSQRHAYTHEGRTVYEWDQTIADVNMYIEVPPGVKAKAMFCDITATHLRFGLHGNPPFMEGDLAGKVKVSECFWTLEDSTLHVTLTKAQVGDPWPSAMAGHGSPDGTTQQADQKRLMLERFQVEHPGFDFSGAEFSGEAPNPRTFLGGMKST